MAMITMITITSVILFIFNYTILVSSLHKNDKDGRLSGLLLAILFSILPFVMFGNLK